MQSRKSSVRTVLSLLLAVVFAIAATPGSMAMPARGAAHHTTAMHAMAMDGMDCSGQAAARACDHMKSHQDQNQGQPCKTMAACLGMLSCFGMGAIDLAKTTPFVAYAEPSIAISHQQITGRTLRPDNPPPIA